ncbi:hypothetical protein I2485_13915 [Nesterenkonia sp. E16_7]|uniref:hypothetical protein n=1 Tax=unclassified Nesterenkonia TaxID=2629769 RepID=UPI001A92CBDC|nr:MULTISPECIES: hypothetical protein [unclassified Nesterenkonia]MBO0596305.1 hypothetical protein [Nesterenkonia sp. E16_10]MBO0599740.1 hypothetical protein [Nesterenkonia sp. E16_7]
MNLGALGLLFVSAGLYIQDFRGLDIHGLGAIGLHVTSGVLAVALLLMVKVAKTGLVPALLAAATFGLSFLQAAVGGSMTLMWHVSGALLLTVMLTWVTAWAFSSRRRGEEHRRIDSRHHSLEGASS